MKKYVCAFENTPAENTALLKAGNNRTRAADAPGISRRTLLYRIKEYNISVS
ncbi:MAG TPA: helix-turn-helix domain-containing protein [Candidatus Goldiibacteriota bacterium]|nr:helix-turn-helix domain-containing protein [Candidatus Goldiibacteriota bacterium]